MKRKAKGYWVVKNYTANSEGVDSVEEGKMARIERILRENFNSRTAIRYQYLPQKKMQKSPGEDGCKLSAFLKRVLGQDR